MTKNTNDILELVDSYSNWFKKELKTNSLKESEFSVIHTPFINNHNDNISIYAKVSGNDILLSDDSDTMNTLEMIGLNLTPKRIDNLDYILRKYNLSILNNEITAKANKSNFPRVIHSLISGIIDIGNLHLTSQERVASFFSDDVKIYLDRNEIYYTADISFQGKSNYTHNYDLLFQKNKNHPERLANIVDSPSRAKISNLLFSWSDIRDVRESNNTELLVFLNDKDKFSSNILEALDEYNVKSILWSEKEDYLEYLR